MKYAIVIPDGCADEPQASLGGKTPLQAAKTPAMDEIARLGVVGRSNNVPPSLPAGSDVACLSLLGYKPLEQLSGRRPPGGAGKLPATNIWLWGLGRALRLTSFQHLYGVQGTMITAVDLLRGLAALVGWKRIEVPGATGYIDTDYAAKGRFAIKALPDTDLLCVHVEASDEASHMGNTEEKVKSLEQIDEHIVAPLHEALKKQGGYRILISPDHPTP